MFLRGTRLLPALALVLVWLTGGPVSAQPRDETDVVATVQRLFDAMEKCDAAGVRAVTVSEGRLFRLAAGPEQPPRSTTLEQFAAQFASCPRKLLERMWAPQVRVHKGIAALWAPYDFWIDGAFSHCGIDNFQLVKTAEGWKLTGGIYTVEREGCGPSPLGVPIFK